MRRTFAPSSRQACVFNKINPVSLSPKNEVFNNTCNTSKSEENSQLAGAQVETSNTTVYNVVWGKKSTKKHKTWEGDGTLEVYEKSVVLKDTEGKILGRTARPKLIEEAAVFSVGNKEVQVIELCSSNSIKVPKEVPQPIKNLKRKTTSFLSPRNVKRSASFHSSYEPLRLPDPPEEHRNTHNVNNLPIVSVTVDPCLARILRPHQRIGVTFLYRCTMGFLGENIGHGAILADEMGLGKTLQCITLIWTLLKHGPYGDVPVLKKIIVVTPSSLVGNWQNEFNHWLGAERIQTFSIDAKNKPKDFVRYGRVPVMIISYEMFARYYDDIKEIKFDMVICDEGHRLKNSSIKISTALSRLECRRRIILTGTPIQNDIREFYSLVDFVNPGVLGDVAEYRKYFEDAIVASRQPDADDDVRESGEERAAQLNAITSSFILRRTQEINDKYLPSKQETVVFCKMSELQKELYSAAVDFWESRNEIDFQSGIVQHLSVITVLKKICNHPSLISRPQDDEDEENDAVNQSEIIDRLTRLLPEWDRMSVEDSGKLKVIDEMLKSLVATGEKVVLVSYFTQTLDMLAGLCDHNSYKYCRLDGSTPSGQRTQIVERFNKPCSDAFVFLLSARAGGVGLNLIGASRLVMYDGDWNPATDLQAMSRIWRDGQRRSVYIYKLLTTGTIEEKIYQRQISKTGLSGSIVDPQNKNNIKLSEDELKDLFTLRSDAKSLTHELIDCECSCDGSNVIKKADAQNIDGTTENQNLRMNQLEDWEHHGPPFANVSLDKISVTNATDFISFMFINKCTTKN